MRSVSEGVTDLSSGAVPVRAHVANVGANLLCLVLLAIVELDAAVSTVSNHEARALPAPVEADADLWKYALKLRMKSQPSG